MLLHYLAVALVAHRARPFTAALSVLTLALGFACFLTAHGAVAFWGRADAHFANAERTFVVSSEWEAKQVRDGGELRTGVVPRTNPWLARYLREDFPALEAVARVAPVGMDTPVSVGGRAVRLRAFSADADFLTIFDLPFDAGDPREALRAPHSVLLTRDAARRLFGDADPIGRALVLGGGFEAAVTGVIGPIPEPSHMGGSAAAPLRFDMLVSSDFHESSIAAFAARSGEAWTDQWQVTYVLLPRDGSLPPDALRAAFPAFVERHVPAEQIEGYAIAFDLVPVTALLGMALNETLFLHRTGISVASLLLGLGLLVLAVACLDFANLATARAVRRSREVGMRKTLGARAWQVLVQHLVEAGLLAAAALAVAVGAVTALAPALQRATGIDARLPLEDPFAWLVLASALLAVTLVSGAHPAWVLARVPAITVLRAARLAAGPRSLGAWLVGLQFAAAAFLLIAVFVVQQQNARLVRTGLGSTSAPLLVIENDLGVTGIAQETLRGELERLPGVQGATQLLNPPWTAPSGTMPLAASPDAGAIERTALLHIVGADFFDVFDVPLLAGRAFDPARPEDLENPRPGNATTQNLVVSRALAESLGFASPAAAVDQLIYIPLGNPPRPFRIIGVVENKPINISTVSGARPGAYLFNAGRQRSFHVVKLAPNDVAGALAAVDALWSRLAPGVAPSRRFADDYFEEAYRNFLQLNRAFTVLALAASTIAALGLFAMALLAASRRVHEIGVRKTLGATSAEMLRLLLASFSAPVLIANVVAWPFGYVAARAYLNLFIDPVALTPLPFVAALGATALVAALAVAGQTLRAARTAPSRVLRQE